MAKKPTLKHRLNDLLDDEDDSKKELAALLLLLLMRAKKPSTLTLSIGKITTELAKKIAAVRSAGAKLASKHLDSKEAKKPIPMTDKLLIAAAATRLVASAIQQIHMALVKGKATFPEAVSEAVAKVEPKIATIATTEVFTGYNNELVRLVEKQAANGQQIALEWSAILDKRTCKECLALDGSIYEIPANLPPCPAHPNCRCTYIIRIK